VFCRTHGVVGRFRAGSWYSPVRTPIYYPDAVSLLPETTIEQLMAAIDTGEGCSVKDSFARLDLTAAGFRPLFRAEWLTLDLPGARVAPDRRWTALTSEQQLAKWEAAWAESAAGSGFFRPALLADETVGVLAAFDGDRIVAGAIANRSATAIGLSNVFDAGGDLESAWFCGASAARARWGHMPIVSYDSGSSLDAAHEAGYRSIGELVVWHAAGSTAAVTR
jgi:hypothetical protein